MQRAKQRSLPLNTARAYLNTHLTLYTNAGAIRIGCAHLVRSRQESKYQSNEFLEHLEHKTACGCSSIIRAENKVRTPFLCSNFVASATRRAATHPGPPKRKRCGLTSVSNWSTLDISMVPEDVLP